MKTRKCIICYNEFIKAPPEHVIPKSVGGQYTIHLVCETCNSNMNKNIDEIFKDHKIIATYRFFLGVTGRGKKVPNPLRNEKITFDGVEHEMRLTEDLKIQTRLPPSFPPLKELETNKSFEITVDGKDMELVDAYIEKAAKHLNIPKENITIQNKVEKFRPESQSVIFDANNKIILEFSKILYETACDLLDDDFINDSIAIQYASMLKKGEIDEKLKPELNPNEIITNQVFLHTIPSLAELKDSHLIIISGYYGVGLVGFIKIFDSCHVQILSRSEKYSKVGMKFIVNDFENKTLGIYQPDKLPMCSINIYNDGLTDFSKLGEEFKINPPAQNYPVFLETGEKFADNLIDLADDFRFSREVKTDFKLKMDVKLNFSNQLFIKPKSMKSQLPMESVCYHYDIKTIKLRSK